VLHNRTIRPQCRHDFPVESTQAATGRV
jgi:hypothetical protein